ncbi:TPA: tyrosine-type recombinase/integrase [Vibrio parahaemolyticus]
MNDKQIRSLINQGNPTLLRFDKGGKGVYLRISKSGTASWVLRYTQDKKRKLFDMGPYGPRADQISLANVADLAATYRLQIKEGKDPIQERERSILNSLETIDDIATDWLAELSKRLKHPEIPKRVYEKDIAPTLGSFKIQSLKKPDVVALIRQIRDSGRPTIASDALNYCKQIVDHAETLGLIEYNVVLSIKPSRLGLIEKSRKRWLSELEIKDFFATARENKDQFVLDNYQACILLICLGVRKNELLQAKWSEFDLSKGIWLLPEERSKTNESIAYPLDQYLIDIFEQLKSRSYDSEYVFPNRRQSKRFHHISPDTLNAAINKLFKENKLTIPHFTVHDLRRTFRANLSSLGVSDHICERCLNHKVTGSKGAYDVYDYFQERKDAHKLLIDKMKVYF